MAPSEETNSNTACSQQDKQEHHKLAQDPPVEPPLSDQSVAVEPKQEEVNEEDGDAEVREKCVHLLKELVARSEDEIPQKPQQMEGGPVQCSLPLKKVSLALQAYMNRASPPVHCENPPPVFQAQPLPCSSDECCENTSSWEAAITPFIPSSKLPGSPSIPLCVPQDPPRTSRIFMFRLEPVHQVFGEDGQKWYACDLCSARYPRCSKLKKHYLRNHINCRYLSDRDISNCRIIVTRDQPKERKESNAAFPDLYRCNHCVAYFDTRKELKEHLSRHLEERIPKIQPCGDDEACAQSNLDPLHSLSPPLVPSAENSSTVTEDAHSSSLLELSVQDSAFNSDQVSNLSDFAKPSTPSGSPKQLLCLYCDKSFSTMTMHKRHVLRSHPQQSNAHLVSAQDKAVPHKCTFCPKPSSTFEDAPELFQHMMSSHPDLCHPCATCELRFDTKGALDQHLNIAHPDTSSHPAASADVSESAHPAEFSSNASSQAKSNTLRYTCSVCQSEFDDYVAMCRHVRKTHKGKRSLSSLFGGVRSPVMDSRSQSPAPTQEANCVSASVPSIAVVDSLSSITEIGSSSSTPETDSSSSVTNAHSSSSVTKTKLSSSSIKVDSTFSATKEADSFSATSSVAKVCSSLCIAKKDSSFCIVKQDSSCATKKNGSCDVSKEDCGEVQKENILLNPEKDSSSKGGKVGSPSNIKNVNSLLNVEKENSSSLGKGDSLSCVEKEVTLLGDSLEINSPSDTKEDIPYHNKENNSLSSEKFDSAPEVHKGEVFVSSILEEYSSVQSVAKKDSEPNSEVQDSGPHKKNADSLLSDKLEGDKNTNSVLGDKVEGSEPSDKTQGVTCSNKEVDLLSDKVATDKRESDVTNGKVLGSKKGDTPRSNNKDNSLSSRMSTSKNENHTTDDKEQSNKKLDAPRSEKENSLKSDKMETNKNESKTQIIEEPCSKREDSVRNKKLDGLLNDTMEGGKNENNASDNEKTRPRTKKVDILSGAKLETGENENYTSVKVPFNQKGGTTRSKQIESLSNDKIETGKNKNDVKVISNKKGDIPGNNNSDKVTIDRNQNSATSSKESNKNGDNARDNQVDKLLNDKIATGKSENEVLSGKVEYNKKREKSKIKKTENLSNDKVGDGKNDNDTVDGKVQSSKTDDKATFKKTDSSSDKVETDRNVNDTSEEKIEETSNTDKKESVQSEEIHSSVPGLDIENRVHTVHQESSSSDSNPTKNNVQPSINGKNFETTEENSECNIAEKYSVELNDRVVVDKSQNPKLQTEKKQKSSMSSIDETLDSVVKMYTTHDTKVTDKTSKKNSIDETLESVIKNYNVAESSELNKEVRKSSIDQILDFVVNDYNTSVKGKEMSPKSSIDDTLDCVVRNETSGDSKGTSRKSSIDETLDFVIRNDTSGGNRDTSRKSSIDDTLDFVVKSFKPSFPKIKPLGRNIFKLSVKKKSETVIEISKKIVKRGRRTFLAKSSKLSQKNVKLNLVKNRRHKAVNDSTHEAENISKEEEKEQEIDVTGGIEASPIKKKLLKKAQKFSLNGSGASDAFIEPSKSVRKNKKLSGVVSIQTEKKNQPNESNLGIQPYKVSPSVKSRVAEIVRLRKKLRTKNTVLNTSVGISRKGKRYNTSGVDIQSSSTEESVFASDPKDEDSARVLRSSLKNSDTDAGRVLRSSSAPATQRLPDMASDGKRNETLESEEAERIRSTRGNKLRKFSRRGEPDKEDEHMDPETLFYCRISTNIRENLLHHLDGKLESEQTSLDDRGRDSAALHEEDSATSDKHHHHHHHHHHHNHHQKVSWEKFTFPKNYDGHCKEGAMCLASFIKDMSHLDISTQLMMRQNLQRLSLPSAATTSTGHASVAGALYSEADNADVIGFSKGLSLNAKVLTDKPRRRSLRAAASRGREAIAAALPGGAASTFTASNALRRWSSADDVAGALVELSGEWVRPRSYICAACGFLVNDLWDMEDHKWNQHPNVWCTHYDFEQATLEQGIDGNKPSSPRELCRRFLLVRDSAEAATSPPLNSEVKCTKCERSFTSLPELHRHILECGGDTTWMLLPSPGSNGRRNRKWRPFGSRRRRQQSSVRRGMKRNIPATPVKQYNRSKHRAAGDSDSIQRMLANLPSKRATRRVIQFSEDEIKTRSQGTIQSVSLTSVVSRNVHKVSHRMSVKADSADGVRRLHRLPKRLSAPPDGIRKNIATKEIVRSSSTPVPHENEMQKRATRGGRSLSPSSSQPEPTPAELPGETKPKSAHKSRNRIKKITQNDEAESRLTADERSSVFEEPEIDISPSTSKPDQLPVEPPGNAKPKSVHKSRSRVKKISQNSATENESTVKEMTNDLKKSDTDASSPSKNPELSHAELPDDTKSKSPHKIKNFNKKITQTVGVEIEPSVNEIPGTSEEVDIDIGSPSVSTEKPGQLSELLLHKSKAVQKSRSRGKKIVQSNAIEDTPAEKEKCIDLEEFDVDITNVGSAETSSILAAMRIAMLEGVITEKQSPASPSKSVTSKRKKQDESSPAKKKVKLSQSEIEERFLRNKGYTHPDEATNDPFICKGCGLQFDSGSAELRHRKTCIYIQPVGKPENIECSAADKKQENPLEDKRKVRRSRSEGSSPVKLNSSDLLKQRTASMSSDADDRMPELHKEEPLESLKTQTPSPKVGEDLCDIPILSPVGCDDLEEKKQTPDVGSKPLPEVSPLKKPLKKKRTIKKPQTPAFIEDEDDDDDDNEDKPLTETITTLMKPPQSINSPTSSKLTEPLEQLDIFEASKTLKPSKSPRRTKSLRTDKTNSIENASELFSTNLSDTSMSYEFQKPGPPSEMLKLSKRTKLRADKTKESNELNEVSEILNSVSGDLSENSELLQADTQSESAPIFKASETIKPMKRSRKATKPFVSEETLDSTGTSVPPLLVEFEKSVKTNKPSRRTKSLENVRILESSEALSAESLECVKPLDQAETFTSAEALLESETVKGTKSSRRKSLKVGTSVETAETLKSADSVKETTSLESPEVILKSKALEATCALKGISPRSRKIVESLESVETSKSLDSLNSVGMLLDSETVKSKISRRKTSKTEKSVECTNSLDTAETVSETVTSTAPLTRSSLKSSKPEGSIDNLSPSKSSESTEILKPTESTEKLLLTETLKSTKTLKRRMLKPEHTQISVLSEPFEQNKMKISQQLEPVDILNVLQEFDSVQMGDALETVKPTKHSKRKSLQTDKPLFSKPSESEEQLKPSMEYENTENSDSFEMKPTKLSRRRLIKFAKPLDSMEFILPMESEEHLKQSKEFETNEILDLPETSKSLKSSKKKSLKTNKALESISMSLESEEQLNQSEELESSEILDTSESLKPIRSSKEKTIKSTKTLELEEAVTVHEISDVCEALKPSRSSKRKSLKISEPLLSAENVNALGSEEPSRSSEQIESSQVVDVSEALKPLTPSRRTGIPFESSEIRVLPEFEPQIPADESGFVEISTVSEATTPVTPTKSSKRDSSKTRKSMDSTEICELLESEETEKLLLEAESSKILDTIEFVSPTKSSKRKASKTKKSMDSSEMSKLLESEESEKLPLELESGKIFDTSEFLTPTKSSKRNSSKTRKSVNSTEISKLLESEDSEKLSVEFESAKILDASEFLTPTKSSKRNSSKTKKSMDSTEICELLESEESEKLLLEAESDKILDTIEFSTPTKSSKRNARKSVDSTEISKVLASEQSGKLPLEFESGNIFGTPEFLTPTKSSKRNSSKTKKSVSQTEISKLLESEESEKVSLEFESGKILDTSEFLTPTKASKTISSKTKKFVDSTEIYELLESEESEKLLFEAESGKILHTSEFSTPTKSSKRNASKTKKSVDSTEISKLLECAESEKLPLEFESGKVLETSEFLTPTKLTKRNASGTKKSVDSSEISKLLESEDSENLPLEIESGRILDTSEFLTPTKLSRRNTSKTRKSVDVTETSKLLESEESEKLALEFDSAEILDTPEFLAPTKSSKRKAKAVKSLDLTEISKPIEPERSDKIPLGFESSNILETSESFTPTKSSKRKSLKTRKSVESAEISKTLESEELEKPTVNFESAKILDTSETLPTTKSSKRKLSKINKLEDSTEMSKLSESEYPTMPTVGIESGGTLNLQETLKPTKASRKKTLKTAVLESSEVPRSLESLEPLKPSVDFESAEILETPDRLKPLKIPKRKLFQVTQSLESTETVVSEEKELKSSENVELLKVLDIAEDLKSDKKLKRKSVKKSKLLESNELTKSLECEEFLKIPEELESTAIFDIPETVKPIKISKRKTSKVRESFDSSGSESVPLAALVEVMTAIPSSPLKRDVMDATNTADLPEKEPIRPTKRTKLSKLSKSNELETSKFLASVSTINLSPFESQDVSKQIELFEGTISETQTSNSSRSEANKLLESTEISESLVPSDFSSEIVEFGPTKATEFLESPSELSKIMKSKKRARALKSSDLSKSIESLMPSEAIPNPCVPFEFTASSLPSTPTKPFKSTKTLKAARSLECLKSPEFDSTSASTLNQHNTLKSSEYSEIPTTSLSKIKMSPDSLLKSAVTVKSSVVPKSSELIFKDHMKSSDHLEANTALETSDLLESASEQLKSTGLSESSLPVDTYENLKLNEQSITAFSSSAPLKDSVPIKPVAALKIKKRIIRRRRNIPSWDRKKRPQSKIITPRAAANVDEDSNDDSLPIAKLKEVIQKKTVTTGGSTLKIKRGQKKSILKNDEVTKALLEESSQIEIVGLNSGKDCMQYAVENDYKQSMTDGKHLEGKDDIEKEATCVLPMQEAIMDQSSVETEKPKETKKKMKPVIKKTNITPLMEEQMVCILPCELDSEGEQLITSLGEETSNLIGGEENITDVLSAVIGGEVGEEREEMNLLLEKETELEPVIETGILRQARRTRCNTSYEELYTWSDVTTETEDSSQELPDSSIVAALGNEGESSYEDLAAMLYPSVQKRKKKRKLRNNSRQYRNGQLRKKRRKKQKLKAKLLKKSKPSNSFIVTDIETGQEESQDSILFTESLKTVEESKAAKKKLIDEEDKTEGIPKPKRKSSLGSLFYCEVCKKHFSTNYNLIKHKQTLSHKKLDLSNPIVPSEMENRPHSSLANFESISKSVPTDTNTEMESIPIESAFMSEAVPNDTENIPLSVLKDIEALSDAIPVDVVNTDKVEQVEQSSTQVTEEMEVSTTADSLETSVKTSVIVRVQAVVDEETPVVDLPEFVSDTIKIENSESDSPIPENPPLSESPEQISSLKESIPTAENLMNESTSAAQNLEPITVCPEETNIVHNLDSSTKEAEVMKSVPVSKNSETGHFNESSPKNEGDSMEPASAGIGMETHESVCNVDMISNAAQPHNLNQVSNITDTLIPSSDGIKLENLDTVSEGTGITNLEAVNNIGLAPTIPDDNSEMITPITFVNLDAAPTIPDDNSEMITPITFVNLDAATKTSETIDRGSGDNSGGLVQTAVTQWTEHSQPENSNQWVYMNQWNWSREMGWEPDTSQEEATFFQGNNEGLGSIMNSVNQILDNGRYADMNDIGLLQPSCSEYPTGLRELQQAMGATDEEMAMLQQLGESNWPLEDADIMDLDSQKSSIAHAATTSTPTTVPPTGSAAASTPAMSAATSVIVPPLLRREPQFLSVASTSGTQYQVSVEVRAPRVVGTLRSQDFLLTRYENKDMVCPVCTRRFLGLTALKTHLNAAHNNSTRHRTQTVIKRPRMLSIPKTGKDGAPVRYVCEVCKELLPDEQGLADHVEVAHIERPTPLLRNIDLKSEWGSSSSSGRGDEGLRSHMTSALGGLLTRALNNFLGKKGSQPSPAAGAASTSGLAQPVTSLLTGALQSSVRRQSSEEDQPYNCEDCDVRFTTESNRNRHIARAHRNRRASSDTAQTSGPKAAAETTTESDSSPEKEGEKASSAVPECVEKETEVPKGKQKMQVDDEVDEEAIRAKAVAALKALNAKDRRTRNGFQGSSGPAMWSGVSGKKSRGYNSEERYRFPLVRKTPPSINRFASLAEKKRKVVTGKAKENIERAKSDVYEFQDELEQVKPLGEFGLRSIKLEETAPLCEDSAPQAEVNVDEASHSSEGPEVSSLNSIQPARKRRKRWHRIIEDSDDETSDAEIVVREPRDVHRVALDQRQVNQREQRSEESRGVKRKHAVVSGVLVEDRQHAKKAKTKPVKGGSKRSTKTDLLMSVFAKSRPRPVPSYKKTYTESESDSGSLATSVAMSSDDERTVTSQSKQKKKTL